MKKYKAIVFDVDGTLTDEVSWITLTNQMGASGELHAEIFDDFRRGILSYTHAKKQLLDMWNHTGNANRKFIEGIFQKINIKNDAKPVIDWLQEQGFFVCLITGSLDVFAEVVAKRLSVKDHYANSELIFDSEGKLIDFHYELDQATKKLDQFERFCENYKLKEHEVIIVGDSDNDVKLFDITENGILIGGNEELAKHARRTILNLSEIKKIVS